jgi:hypothetical protein
MKPNGKESTQRGNALALGTRRMINATISRRTLTRP